jgi:K+-transporting ATPase c subunit
MRRSHKPPRRRLRAVAAVGVLACAAAVAAVLPAVSPAKSNSAPVNSSAPRVLGTVAVGQTLTATPGTWSGSPTGYTYQWRRCPQSGGAADAKDCGIIDGATKSAYDVRQADVGFTLRVRVTAANADGTTTATSSHTSVVKAAQSGGAPVNRTEPRVVGTVAVGQTLTATPGTWSGSPTGYTYQWRRCPQSGGAGDANDCGVIDGATKSAYAVRQADVGFTLRVRVTAANADGTATAASNHTIVVKASPTTPSNTKPPTIGGSLAVGQTLTADTGTWTGTAPIAFAYQWLRCDRSGGSCADISGANGKTYVLKTVDAGNTLRVRVSARNSAGTAASSSVPTAIVTAAAPPPAAGPSGCGGSGPLAVDKLNASTRLVIDGLQVSPRVVAGSTGTLVARFHVSSCQGRSIQGALVYAATVPFNQFSVPAEQRTGADGWASLTMHRLSGFPAANRQQLLVMFVRARKPGDNVLGGISSRRLVSFPVSLNT